MPKLLLLLLTYALLALSACALWQEAISPSLVECAPDQQYALDNLAAILDGQNVFEQLDRVKDEKGIEFVVCALRGFLSRVAVSPDTADQRANARAYMHYLEHGE